MSQKHIRCFLLGAQERDLYILGELHKAPGIEIVCVYDRDSAAVGMEIAEILGIRRAASIDEIVRMGAGQAVDYVVIPDTPGMFAMEIEELTATGAKTISQAAALRELCLAHPAPKPQPGPVAVDDAYSVEDAIAAFERLFDRKKLLRFLLDVAVESAGASTGSIMLYSPEARELYIAYASGLSERVVRNTRQRLGEGIAGAVAKERKGRLIRQAAEEALYSSGRDRMRVNSAVSVPLLLDDTLLGVLNVSTSGDEKQLDTDALAKMGKLSGRVARLLHESMRLEETRVRHREFMLRKSVGELTEQAMSTPEKFAMLANMLGELVGAATVEVFVGTDDGDWLMLGGSNRRISTDPQMVRCGGGAISRAFLEKRTVVLTEASGDPDPLENLSSFVFVPLELGTTLGVLMLEFDERARLDDFMLIRDSVTLELSRFIAAERRERRLRRELTAMGKVSEAAPMLLSCRSLDDLCEMIARLVAVVLECDRVSVRLSRVAGGGDEVSRFESVRGGGAEWMQEDEERFVRLRKKKESFALAFLDFLPATVEKARSYHSLIAVPVLKDTDFIGGIIAYDKRPTTVFEEHTFTDLDREAIDQIIALAAPAIAAASPSTQVVADEFSYDAVLAGNLARVNTLVETEMARADRYHNAFNLLVVRIVPLAGLFDADYDKALTLVEDITRGIQTRTRKTDYMSWIRRDTIAFVSLEGTRRIKFLISRLMLYLLKDFDSIEAGPLKSSDVLVGHAVYPGASKTPEALFAEVENSLHPYRDA